MFSCGIFVTLPGSASWTWLAPIFYAFLPRLFQRHRVGDAAEQRFGDLQPVLKGIGQLGDDLAVLGDENILLRREGQVLAQICLELGCRDGHAIASFHSIIANSSDYVNGIGRIFRRNI